MRGLDWCLTPPRAIACFLAVLLVTGTPIDARVIAQERGVNGSEQAGESFATQFAPFVQRSESGLGQQGEHDGCLLAANCGSSKQNDVARQGFWEPSFSKLLAEVSFRDTAEHKPLWPLNWRDALTLLFAVVSLFIAAGGGIGGGGVLVPLFILILGFKTNVAVALSNITIVGGALVNFGFNVNKRHAHFKRPLIDWDLILVMEPATILGALIGGYFNRVAPSYLTTVLLALLLTFLTYKLVVRALSTWQKETASLQAEAARAADPAAALRVPLIPPPAAPPANGDAERGITSSNRALTISTRARRTDSADENFSGSPLAYTRINSMDDFRQPSMRRMGSRVHVHTALPAVGADSAFEGWPAVSGSAPSASPGLTSQSAVPQWGGRSHQDNPSVTGETLGIQGGIASVSEGVVPPTHHMQPPPLHVPPNLAVPPNLPVPQNLHVPPRRTEGEAAGKTEAGETSRPPLQKVESLATRFGESRQVPPLKFGILVLLFFAVLGADFGKQFTTCGTLTYWAVVLSIIPIVLLVTWGVRIYLVRDFHAREAAGYEWREGDVEWSERNTIVYPLICSIAGLVAGAFGVGGGIVKGPLMLEMGILPDVAAATSATMICFTAASASVVYLSFGGIPLDYAITVFLMGVVATLAGQLATHWLVTHLNRRSIIIIAMASLMFISMVIIYYEAVLQLYNAIVNHALNNFHPICPPTAG